MFCKQILSRSKCATHLGWVYFVRRLNSDSSIYVSLLGDVLNIHDVIFHKQVSTTTSTIYGFSSIPDSGNLRTFSLSFCVCDNEVYNVKKVKEADEAVTHPSTNWARCRATALIETNALSLHQTANQCQEYANETSRRSYGVVLRFHVWTDNTTRTLNSQLNSTFIRQ